MAPSKPPASSPARGAGALKNTALPWWKNSAALLLIAIFLGAGYLALHRLDNTVFWDDEALVGIAAKNYLKTGTVTGWDGRNLLAFRNGSYLDQELRPIDSVLQTYVTATSFRLFGVSTWAGRFPFALSGLLAVLAFGLLLKTEQSTAGHVLYALAALALSVAFLLYIRQCRYYGLSVLFSVLVFLFYRRTLNGTDWWNPLLLAASALGAFFAQYLLGGAFLLALGVMHLICHARRTHRVGWLRLTAAAGLFLLPALPFALVHKVWVRPDMTDAIIRSARWTILWEYVQGLNFIGALPWVIVAIGIWLAIRSRKTPLFAAIVRPWAILCVAYVLILGIATPQSFVTNVPHRYLVPILPFLAGLTGWVLASIPRYLGAVLLAAALGTNLLSLNPLKPELRWRLPAYLREIHQNYPTAYGETVKFLQAAVTPDDVVLACPDYCNFPLMFYLGDKIRIGGLLDRSTSLPKARLEKLAAPLFVSDTFPDWLVIFGAQAEALQLKAFLSRPHPDNGRLVQYQYSVVTNLDVFWYDASKPELRWHEFGPRRVVDPASEAVYILHRNLGP